MKAAISGIVKAYIYALFIVAACWYDNGYFNIIEAKAYVCSIIAAVFVALLAVFAAVYIAVVMSQKRRGKLRTKRTGIPGGQLCLTDAAAAAFCAEACVSCFSGDSAKAALLGSGGWGCGALLILLLVILYVFISRFTDITNEKLLLPLIIGGYVTFIWAILNYCGIDIAGMHEGFADTAAVRFYLGGIGNVDNFVPYISMMLPFAIAAFALVGKILWKVMLGIYIFLGGFCTVIIVADSVYLGLGLAFFFIILYFAGSVSRLRRISLSFAVFFSGVAFAGLPGRLLACKANMIDGISGILLHKHICILCAAFFLIMYIVLRSIKREPGRKAVLAARAVISAAFITAAITGAALFTRGFNDDWGSSRGFIWKRAVMIFASLPASQKLFGVGADTFGTVFHRFYNREILARFGMTVSNAHNELLQYLLTTGFAGLLSYISIYITAFIDAVKRKERPPLSFAAFFGVIGYAGQALVNNPHAFNCSVLFFLLALFTAGTVSNDYKSTSLPLSADS